MNARTQSLAAILALTLTACVATIPAPPPRVQPALPEQTLPLQPAPAQSVLPATQMTQPTDVQAAALLEAQKQLISQLMVGVPPQVRSYIETYAAIEVVRQQTPATLPAEMTPAQKQLVSQLMVGVPEEVQPYIETYAAVEVVRQQKAMVLPELIATNPKSREVQAMDDLLKPEVLPAESTAAKIALLEQAAQTVPPQVREAIYDYIDTLQPSK